MSVPTSRPSAYFRKSGRAIVVALTLGGILGAVGLFMEWFVGGMGRVRPYLVFFQPFVLGYAFGRIHQLADQREYHSDPRTEGRGRL